MCVYVCVCVNRGEVPGDKRKHFEAHVMNLFCRQWLMTRHEPCIGCVGIPDVTLMAMKRPTLFWRQNQLANKGLLSLLFSAVLELNEDGAQLQSTRRQLSIPICQVRPTKLRFWRARTVQPAAHCRSYSSEPMMEIDRTKKSGQSSQTGTPSDYRLPREDRSKLYRGPVGHRETGASSTSHKPASRTTGGMCTAQYVPEGAALSRPDSKTPKRVAKRDDRRRDSRPLVVFDLETTSLDKHSEVTQIAAQTLDGPRSFSTFALPDGRISPEASKVTGLTVRTVGGKRVLYKRDAPVKALSQRDALKSFSEWLHGLDGDIVLVAHCCFMFDMHVLLNAAEREGVELSCVVGFADSHPAAKKALPHLGSYKLTSIYADLFGKPPKQAHEAVADTAALARVARRIEDGIRHTTIPGPQDRRYSESTRGQMVPRRSWG